MKPLKIGVIGCGRISDIYFQTLGKFDAVNVVACASLDLAESQEKAKKYKIPKACSVEDILDDPEIDAVLNLTIPAAHAKISMQALEHGKHVYSEKPFVTDLTEGSAILEFAQSKGLKVGNAPDTFFGGRWQTVRKLIDEGAIGTPTSVFAYVGTHGTERHNPNPDFYYQKGGGPMLDLGPYYLTALIFFLGPIKRVAGMSNRGFQKRQIENGPRNGTWMDVEIDTHVQGMLEFESGVIGTITMSFDVWDSETPRLEIHGTEGSICIPDPDPVHGANIFQGEVWMRTKETSRWTHQPRPQGRAEWESVPIAHGLNEDSRGIGLVDLAYAIIEKRPPRASGEIAHHVLEAMLGILSSQETGNYVTLHSRADRPSLLPEKFPTEA